MAQRDEIIAEMRAMHNDIGFLTHGELARLVGFHEDESDYYYRVRVMNGHTTGRNEYFSSYVGAFVSLRGAQHYDNLDRVFALNGAPPSEEFLITDEAALLQERGK